MEPFAIFITATTTTTTAVNFGKLLEKRPAK
jgi:hypothetical protein